MRKIFIFMLLCSCCISINAQDGLADCHAKTDSVNTKQVSVSDFFNSELYKSMRIMALESEYDVIYRDVPPSMIIASRGDKYYKVEIFTGEETEIDRQQFEVMGRRTDTLHASQSQENEEKKEAETDDE